MIRLCPLSYSHSWPRLSVQLPIEPPVPSVLHCANTKTLLSATVGRGNVTVSDVGSVLHAAYDGSPPVLSQYAFGDVAVTIWRTSAAAGAMPMLARTSSARGIPRIRPRTRIVNLPRHQGETRRRRAMTIWICMPSRVATRKHLRRGNARTLRARSDRVNRQKRGRCGVRFWLRGSPSTMEAPGVLL